MSAETLAAKVDARLATIANTDRVDGGILKTPTRPYFSIGGGIQTGSEQRYGSASKRVTWSYTVMAVNNTPTGARRLADLACGLLNDRERTDLPTDGMYSWLDYSGPLIDDTQIEGDWRHSITLHLYARTEETP